SADVVPLFRHSTPDLRVLGASRGWRRPVVRSRYRGEPGMKHAGWAVVALALAACSQPQAETKTAEIPAPAPVQEAGCSAETARDWSAVGSQYYVIEAEARGETCADAVATLRIRSRDGAMLFTRD